MRGQATAYPTGIEEKMALAEQLNWRIAVAEDNNRIISLDFDGVIHNYLEWDGPVPTGEPVPGALETIWWLLNAGYKVFILSTRAHENPMGKAGIEEWLMTHGFPILEVTAEKRHADLYVDDRGFRFMGPQSWQALRDFLAVNPKPGRWGKNAG